MVVAVSVAEAGLVRLMENDPVRIPPPKKWNLPHFYSIYLRLHSLLHYYSILSNCARYMSCSHVVVLLRSHHLHVNSPDEQELRTSSCVLRIFIKTHEHKGSKLQAYILCKHFHRLKQSKIKYILFYAMLT